MLGHLYQFCYFQIINTIQVTKKEIKISNKNVLYKRFSSLDVFLLMCHNHSNQLLIFLKKNSINLEVKVF